MITAQAHSNIALIKYWGKRSNALKLPVNNSISLTLDQLYTRTTVEIQADLTQDQLFLNGELATPGQTAKVQAFMDLLRQQFDCHGYAAIHSTNSFPTGAGLASSASGFAALALAASHSFGLHLSSTELSRLARQGSGSACRSLFGGWAEWLRGENPDGSDSYAIPLAANPALSLAMLVLIVENKPKETGSTDGMAHCVATSPYFSAWQATIEHDLGTLRTALQTGDFAAIGQVMEYNCLKMHATTITAQPAIWYWQPATLVLLQHVYQLRQQGIMAFFTIDAGPNVKVLCQEPDRAKLVAYFESLSEVQQVIPCKPGPAAFLV